MATAREVYSSWATIHTLGFSKCPCCLACDIHSRLCYVNRFWNNGWRTVISFLIYTNFVLVIFLGPLLVLLIVTAAIYVLSITLPSLSVGKTEVTKLNLYAESTNNSRVLKADTRNNRCQNLKNKKSFFVSVRFHGGTGNLMFQYAFVYALSQTFKYTLMIPEVESLRKAFNIKSNEKQLGVGDLRIQKECFKYVNAYGKDSAFDKRNIYPINTDTYFEGFFQSWKYFESYSSELRHIFTPSSSILIESKRIISRAISKFSQKDTVPTLVGIHVRRGDIIVRKHYVQYGYRVADERYLHDALKYFRKKYKNVVFIATSNDHKWTRKTIGGEPDVYISKGHSPETDMATLIQTNHTITTVGTFGWWIGFLTNGETLYFKYPFREGSSLAGQFDRNGDSFFPPNWKGI